MELIEAIKKRRSIRKFKSDKIPKEDIYDIIRAATLAPSNCCISVRENTSGRETLEINGFSTDGNSQSRAKT